LDALTRADRAVVGAKAAALGELARAGFPVPEGFVVTDESDEAVSEADRMLRGVPLAVRSSALAEDLADASFAGQYETVLDVHGADALAAAIWRVRQSATGARVRGYQAARAATEPSGIAVLVQRMLTPEAAGVAFTANPVTGDRREVVVAAARGLGERLVAGETVGDEWTVRDGQPICRRSVEHAIDAGQAAAIAGLARHVESHFGTPQDIEWAIEQGHLYLLQARPMTALPPPANWTPPSPGYWMRTFRLGEWLPEPMSPLFHDWLLGLIEAGYLQGMRATAGAVVPFQYAAINGWYYTAVPGPRAIPGIFVRALVQSRGRVLHVLLNGALRPSSQPEVADRALLRRLAKHWRDELLPRYRQVVATGARRVETAAPAQIEEIIDAVGLLAGEYLWSLAIVGGSAWKMEGCLARFLRQHLPLELEGGVQLLLSGLAVADLAVPAHAVQSVDWYWPTAGERRVSEHRPAPSVEERRRQLDIKRERAEAACRQALADRPAILARFEALLEVARRYASLREEQAHWFTLGWPLLRRCVLRLGDVAQSTGIVDRSEDLFFLTRSELRSPTGRQDTVVRRRAEWDGQRRLVAPLTIGKPPWLLVRSLATVVEAVRTGGQPSDGAIVGQPASPGRATGRVCIIHDVADFERFQQGDVLVARATAPAWTPLFGRAAAVVTDGGTLAAHASLVAREYGIPAVVGTADATTRLRDGQEVIVDGSAGTVTPGGSHSAHAGSL